MKLYAITDYYLTPQKTILKQVKTALKAGVSIVQFRDKISSDEQVYTTCKALQELCEDYEALFFINDRLNLAIKLNSYGLHVGKDDESLEKIKQTYNGKIGISCYNDINLAKIAKKNGATYVAFGAFFDTNTKKDASKASFNVLKDDLQIKKAVIGGINCNNIAQFAPYNVDIICQSSGIFKGDIEKNVKMSIDNYYRSKHA